MFRYPAVYPASQRDDTHGATSERASTAEDAADRYRNSLWPGEEESESDGDTGECIEIAENVHRKRGAVSGTECSDAKHDAGEHSVEQQTESELTRVRQKKRGRE